MAGAGGAGRLAAAVGKPDAGDAPVVAAPNDAPPWRARAGSLAEASGLQEAVEHGGKPARAVEADPDEVQLCPLRWRFVDVEEQRCASGSSCSTSAHSAELEIVCSGTSIGAAQPVPSGPSTASSPSARGAGVEASSGALTATAVNRASRCWRTWAGSSPEGGAPQLEPATSRFSSGTHRARYLRVLHTPPPPLVGAQAVAPLHATQDWPACPHELSAVPERQTPSWQQPEQLKTLQSSCVPQPARSTTTAARPRKYRDM